MSFDLSLFNGYWLALLQGLGLTVEMWILGSLIAVAIGLACGLLLPVAPRPVRAAIRGYVEFFRGTPLLIQLFMFYFGAPHIGITLDAFTVGIWGLGLYGGAYFTEIFRAGFTSVPAGQIEAARSFGISRSQTIRRIVLPQMLVVVLPPSVNMLIVVLKDTAVLSILTIPELTFQVTGMTLDTFAFVEPYTALAIGYWLLVEATSFAGRAAERRMSRNLALAA